MKVERDMVLHVARLANLNLTEPEIETFAVQLTGILSYMQKLEEIEVTAEPFTFARLLKLPVRTDDPAPSLPVEEALKNAPDREKNFFRVPRILP
jgi:aspartyl-tRNA(Asn)/glutamyl-tRNA(Gln) amidotransferase subunit C